MNVILTKKINLKSAIVYLRIQKKVKREDIQNYLQGKHFNNPIVENRVREYLKLKNVGIYDEQYNLTKPYGYEVRDKGMVKENEEGKYQIWYTQNDPLFGNRVFYFRRIIPESYNQKQEPVPFKYDFSRRIFRSLPIHGKYPQDSIEFSIIDDVKECPAEIINKVTEISFIWTWNDTESSSFVFSGNFETVPIDNKPVDFNIDLEQHIPIIIPNWNPETQRCKIKIENIEKDDTYQYFEYSGNLPLVGYDTREFYKLPVEPDSPEEAVLWRDKIINTELEKKYMLPDDFEGIVNAINQNEGFIAYKDLLKLDVPTAKDYLNKISPSDVSKRGAAYWHLAAPLDLNINISNNGINK